MANQITVGLAADSSKLTAELAIAKQAVTDFGKDLREAVKTGDKDKIAVAATDYDNEIRNVTKLTSAVKEARAAKNELGAENAAGSGGWFGNMQAAFSRMQATMRPVMEEAKGHFSELHARASEFGNAVSNVAGNIFPRFRDVLAIGAIGSGAAMISMVRSTAEWGHELQKAADTLGVTVNEMSGLKKAGKDVGVDGDALVRGLTRFSVAFDKSSEDQKKLAVEATQIIYGNVQRMGGGIADLTKRAEDGLKRVYKVGDSDFSKIGDQIRQAFNLGGIGGALPGETFDAFKIRAEASLRGVGKEAEKLREIIFKMGGDISAGNLSTALERGVKGYRDVFKTLGVSITDADGNMRKFTDSIVDFVAAFRKLDSGKQASIAKEIEGRGFAEMLPFLKMDPNVLRGHLDEAEKNKGLDTQIKSADALYKMLLRLDMAFAGLKKAMILPFVDVFAGPTASMETFVKGMQKDVAAFSRSIATTMKPIAQDIGNIFKGGKAQTEFGKEFVYWKGVALDAIAIVKGAFTGLVHVLDGVAESINAVFGTKWSGQGILIAIAVAQMTGAFAFLATGIGFAVAAFKALRAASLFLYANPIYAVLAAIAFAAIEIYAHWDELLPLFQRIWDSLKLLGENVSGAFVAAWNTAAGAIKSAWSDLTGWISSQIDQILGLITKVVSAAQAAAQTIAGLLGAAGGSSAAPTSGGGVAGAGPSISGGASVYASGGYISGPGTGTSDSILSRVSNGEFIVNAASTSRHLPLLHAINSAGYAMGGLVGRALGFSPSIPSFAGGGLVGAGGGQVHQLDLSFNGGTPHRVSGDAGTLNSLMRTARHEQMTKAGRMPGWHQS